MLTIHPPIRLRSQQNTITMHQDFDERIRGNYSQMEESVRRQELLYLTSEAPEVYFAEGSTTNIMNDIRNENKQEIRLEVINQLVNRILLSANADFTYQDKVYISNTLRKLGITDVNTFMSQVVQLRQETKANQQLLKLYTENAQYLTQVLANQEKEQAAGTGKHADAVSEEKRYYLHDAIYQRLHTEQVYAQVTNFAQSQSLSETTIHRNEFLTAEQNTIAKALFLQELKNTIYEEGASLNFVYRNVYELPGEEEESPEQAEDRMSAALLLNIVDQAYQLRVRQIEQHEHQWYTIAGSLFESAVNTYNRYESTHNSGAYAPQMTQQMVRHGDVYLEHKSPEQLSPEEGTQLLEEERVRVSEQLKRSLETARNTYNRYETTRTYTQEGQPYMPAEREAELVERILKEEVQPDIISENPPAEVRTLTEELHRINEENTQKYQLLQQEQAKVPQLIDRRVDRNRAKRDILRAIDHQSEVIQEIVQQSQEEAPVLIHNDRNEAIYNMISEETRNIFEMAETQGRLQRENPLLQHPEYLKDLEAVSRGEIPDSLLTEPARQSKSELEKAKERLLQKTVEENTRQIEHVYSEHLQEVEDTRKAVHFVHKVQETLDTEELLNQIQLQKTQQQVHETTTIQNHEEHRTVQNRVLQTTSQQLVEETQNVEELVRKNVTQQMGRISDEVYGRIERRLSTERKRRGF